MNFYKRIHTSIYDDRCFQTISHSHPTQSPCAQSSWAFMVFKIGRSMGWSSGHWGFALHGVGTGWGAGAGSLQSGLVPRNWGRSGDGKGCSGRFFSRVSIIWFNSNSKSGFWTGPVTGEGCSSSMESPSHWEDPLVDVGFQSCSALQGPKTWKP